jgi:hypothetical protein
MPCSPSGSYRNRREEKRREFILFMVIKNWHNDIFRANHRRSAINYARKLTYVGINDTSEDYILISRPM